MLFYYNLAAAMAVPGKTERLTLPRGHCSYYPALLSWDSGRCPRRLPTGDPLQMTQPSDNAVSLSPLQTPRCPSLPCRLFSLEPSKQDPNSTGVSARTMKLNPKAEKPPHSKENHRQNEQKGGHSWSATPQTGQFRIYKEVCAG